MVEASGNKAKVTVSYENGLYIVTVPDGRTFGYVFLQSAMTILKDEIQKLNVNSNPIYKPYFS